LKAASDVRLEEGIRRLSQPTEEWKVLPPAYWAQGMTLKEILLGGNSNLSPGEGTMMMREPEEVLGSLQKAVMLDDIGGFLASLQDGIDALL
jgi:hypothetical protein